MASFSIVLTTYWANRHFIICFILVSRLNNPLINDLYADTILYAYPVHVLRFFNESGWGEKYKKLGIELRQMIDLRRKGEEKELWDLIHTAYLEYDKDYASGKCQADLKKAYTWGKPDICHSIARELIYRIYCEKYPVDTFCLHPKPFHRNFPLQLLPSGVRSVY